MKLFSILFFLSITLKLFSQQAIPVEMIYAPQENNFSISGVGGGNIHEFKAQNSSASAQLAVDFNINLNEKNYKLKTLSTTVKYNPIAQTRFDVSDDFDINRLAFIDNQYMFFLGLRHYSLKNYDEEEARFYGSFYLDFSVSPYEIISYNITNEGFYNFNTTTGWQGGYTTETNFGVIALTFAVQGNYFYIYDYKTDDWAFDELFGYSEKTLSRQWAGGGAKISFQINDFAVYVEGRQYYPLDNSIQIKDFSNRPVFSIGGIATGTIFRNKRDE